MHIAQLMMIGIASPTTVSNSRRVQGERHNDQ